MGAPVGPVGVPAEFSGFIYILLTVLVSALYRLVSKTPNLNFYNVFFYSLDGFLRLTAAPAPLSTTCAPRHEGPVHPADRTGRNAEPVKQGQSGLRRRRLHGGRLIDVSTTGTRNDAGTRRGKEPPGLTTRGFRPYYVRRPTPTSHHHAAEPARDVLPLPDTAYGGRTWAPKRPTCLVRCVHGKTSSGRVSVLPCPVCQLSYHRSLSRSSKDRSRLSPGSSP